MFDYFSISRKNLYLVDYLDSNQNIYVYIILRKPNLQINFSVCNGFKTTSSVGWRSPFVRNCHFDFTKYIEFTNV